MVSVKGPGGGTGKVIIPTGISVTSVPTKINYKAGEALDLTGMVVTVTYSDETSEDITSECTFNPAPGTILYENVSQIGISWVWEEQVTYNATQSVSVDRVLSSIAISTTPTKKNYYKGEALDLTGMVVTATYTSGASASITGFSSVPANGAALSVLGNTTITINYTENGVTKSATTSVTVSVKTVTWANGTDQEIADMVAAADAGLLNLGDYWTVGQERKVNLAAMASTGVGETHAAQTVTMVLMHAGGKDLVTPVASGRTKCSFIVGLKNCLNEGGYMNSSNTNSGSWDGSARRTWCNNVFKNSIPAALRSIFKLFKTVTAATYNGTTLKTSNDYFALPAEREIFGAGYGYSGSGYSNNTEAASTQLVHFTYYQTAANRIKKLGDAGSAANWWERSPYASVSSYFCIVYSDGSANLNIASSAYGLAPFGCI